MRSLICVTPLLAAACLGPSGPELPPNVGATHAEAARSSGAEAAPPGRAPQPFEVGTPVWSNFRNTGFYFFGVVVERRDAQHHVIYADGASEWVPTEALRPDTIDEGVRLDVRSTYEGDFAQADALRRVGQAVYFRYPTGDEGWATLPHIRFQARMEGAPRPGDEPRVQEAVGASRVGEHVLVDYQRQGLGFAGVITAQRDDGRLHVVYLDGETEWVDPSLVRPEELTEGDVVHIRRRWNPPEWVRGHIVRRVGHAFHVELDDGGVAWTSLFRLRVPVAGNPSTSSANASEPNEGTEH